MSRIIDLSLPIVDGGGRLELQTTFEIPYSFEKHGWQGSVFRMFAHMGTHV
jgi:kynurenine formamidase